MWHTDTHTNIWTSRAAVAAKNILNTYWSWPGGVTHARQRSIRDKQHKLDCQRVADQLLGEDNDTLTRKVCFANLIFSTSWSVLEKWNVKLVQVYPCYALPGWGCWARTWKYSGCIRSWVQCISEKILNYLITCSTISSHIFLLTRQINQNSIQERLLSFFV